MKIVREISINPDIYVNLSTYVDFKCVHLMRIASISLQCLIKLQFCLLCSTI